MRSPERPAKQMPVRFQNERPADGKNAAAKVRGLRHVPLCSSRAGYISCTTGGRGGLTALFAPTSQQLARTGPNEDVRIQGSFRRGNGRATDIARRQNLTQCMVRPCVARRLLRVGDVRSCINVSGLCLTPFVPRAIMDISAPAISLAVRPQWAIWVTSVRMRREDRSSISFLILSQTSAGKVFRRLALNDQAT